MVLFNSETVLSATLSTVVSDRHIIPGEQMKKKFFKWEERRKRQGEGRRNGGKKKRERIKRHIICSRQIAQLVKVLFQYVKVAGSIPGQGTYKN